MAEGHSGENQIRTWGQKAEREGDCSAYQGQNINLKGMLLFTFFLQPQPVLPPSDSESVV